MTDHEVREAEIKRCEALAKKATRMGIFFGIATVLLGVVGVGIAYNHQYKLHAPLSVAVSGLALLIWVVASTDLWRVAFNTLFNRWDEATRNEAWLQKDRESVQKERDGHAAFNTAYRPPQNQIDTVLKDAALGLKEACRNEENVYRNGLGYYATENTDSEGEVRRLELLFTKHLAEAKTRVAAAKAEFWRLHKLAKDNGYAVHDSWQKYLA